MMVSIRDTILNLIRIAYNRLIRSWLPYKISVHNGVAVKGVIRLLDQTEFFPNYEADLISAIRKQARRGDDIVIVGGGIGVSTVAAARATGPGGSVTTYEASSAQYQMINNTLKINDVLDRVSLVHGIVSSYSSYSEDKYGTVGEADVIDPGNLPGCDLLALDCEGAELNILENIHIQPRIIIVEAHAFLNAPEKEVRELLEELDYEVVDREVVDDEKGVYVLTAIARDAEVF